MSRRFVAIITLLLFAANMLAVDVHIRVVDAFGEQITNAGLEIKDLYSTGPSRSMQGKAFKLSLLPGDYVVKVQAPGFKWSRQLLSVPYDSPFYVRIGLNVGQVSESTVPTPIRIIKGRLVSEVPFGKDVWVRLIPINNNERICEMPLSKQGNFVFSGIEHGNYVVQVIQADKLLASQVVSNYGPSPVEVSVRITASNYVP